MKMLMELDTVKSRMQDASRALQVLNIVCSSAEFRLTGPKEIFACILLFIKVSD